MNTTQSSSHPWLSTSSFLVSFVEAEVPRKLSHVSPQEDALSYHEATKKISERDQNLQIRETNDPVAKCFKMRLHVYLEGLGVTSAMAGREGWKCLVSDSWRHVKLLGMRLSRFLLHPISVNSFRVHRGTGLIPKEQQDSEVGLTVALSKPDFLFFVFSLRKLRTSSSWGLWLLMSPWKISRD